MLFFRSIFDMELMSSLSILSSRVLLWICLFLASLTGPNSLADTVVVSGVQVEIPAPDGFVRIDGKNQKWDEQIRSYSPSTGKILIWFGSPSDLAAVLKGEIETAELSFYAVSFNNLEGVKMTPGNFALFKDGFRSQMQTTNRLNQATELLKEAEKRASDSISQRVTLPADFKVGDMIPLGITSENDRSMTGSFLVKSMITLDGGKTMEFVMVNGISLLRLKQDVLLAAYCTSTYKTPEDINGMRESLSRWEKSILEANSRSTAIRDQGYRQKGADTKSLLGFKSVLAKFVAYAIITGLLSLIAFIWVTVTKRRKSERSMTGDSPSKPVDPTDRI